MRLRQCHWERGHWERASGGVGGAGCDESSRSGAAQCKGRRNCAKAGWNARAQGARSLLFEQCLESTNARD